MSDSVNIEKRVSYERCRKKETAKSIVLVGACRVVEDALPGWFAELDREIRGFWMEIRFHCIVRVVILFTFNLSGFGIRHRFPSSGCPGLQL